MSAVENARSARVASVDKRRRTVAAPFRSTPPRSWPPRLPRASRPRAPCASPSRFTWTAISRTRVSTTPSTPESLDLREVVETVAGNPAYEPFCRELLAKGELRATRGKKETTDHPPDLPHGEGDARRSAACRALGSTTSSRAVSSRRFPRARWSRGRRSRSTWRASFSPPKAMCS